jgi:hypothetical protein
LTNAFFFVILRTSFEAFVLVLSKYYWPSTSYVPVLVTYIVAREILLSLTLVEVLLSIVFNKSFRPKIVDSFLLSCRPGFASYSRWVPSKIPTF